MTKTIAESDRQVSPRDIRVKQPNDFVAVAVRVGPVDHASVDEIIELLRSLPTRPGLVRKSGVRLDRLDGARTILDWLLTHPGDGWQDRWLAAGADHGIDWLDTLSADDPRPADATRSELLAGLTCLLLGRVVLPDYGFFSAYPSSGTAIALFEHVELTLRPDLFAQVEAKAAPLGVSGRRLRLAMVALGKLVLHSGRDLDQLRAEDFFTLRVWCVRTQGRLAKGVALAWELLRGIADLGEHASLRDALRRGQRPTSEIVDAYRLRCRPVRDVLVRYLDQRRSALDYRSLVNLASVLAGRFWADIERHHPEVDSLHLPQDVALAWKQRLQTVTLPDGSTRPRANYYEDLIRVRAFYLDIQDWAVEDPSWVACVAPSPVRKGDTDGMVKVKQRTTARMHQRVRDRLPHLPQLVETAERHRADQAAMLAAAEAVAIGECFEHDGRRFRRTVPKSYIDGVNRGQTPLTVLAEDTETGEQVDLTFSEDEAFWSWAVVETLRHTGVRVEELLEITHLALVSYQLPDTGEVVPMLQIVPSKSNEERLLLVGPELASVLATIITRLRQHNGGTVPLTPRYDPGERVVGAPLPHLFQRRWGWRWQVISFNTIQVLLNQTLERTGLRDAASQPLRHTPHDFRRMFATEAVAGGLPVHIVARLLGHANINTTQAYMAIFDEELVRTYQGFLNRRRGLRPQAEYREPTEDEWREFQQHFQLRKLELGECGRPYGTPCKHEHSCLRCPSMRLSPTARPRLVEIIANLRDRVEEARLNGWLGEVAGLEVSLDAAARKLVSLDRMRDRLPAGAIDLGVTPILRDPGPSA